MLEIKPTRITKVGHSRRAVRARLARAGVLPRPETETVIMDIIIVYLARLANLMSAHNSLLIQIDLFDLKRTIVLLQSGTLGIGAAISRTSGAILDRGDIFWAAIASQEAPIHIRTEIL